MRRRAELIRLLGAPLRAKRTASELRDLAVAFGEEELVEAVTAMANSGTLNRGFGDEWFMLSERGRVSWAKGTLEYRSLGLKWISPVAKPATVHIVIATPNDTESHGSAFLVEDYPD